MFRAGLITRNKVTDYALSVSGINAKPLTMRPAPMQSLVRGALDPCGGFPVSQAHRRVNRDAFRRAGSHI